MVRRRVKQCSHAQREPWPRRAGRLVHVDRFLRGSRGSSVGRLPTRTPISTGGPVASARTSSGRTSTPPQRRPSPLPGSARPSAMTRSRGSPSRPWRTTSRSPGAVQCQRRNCLRSGGRLSGGRANPTAFTRKPYVVVTPGSGADVGGCAWEPGPYDDVRAVDSHPAGQPFQRTERHSVFPAPFRPRKPMASKARNSRPLSMSALRWRQEVSGIKLLLGRRTRYRRPLRLSIIARL